MLECYRHVFYLLLGRIATLFIYLTANRLYGSNAAFFLIHKHTNSNPFCLGSKYIWVSTAIVIAIYYLFLLLDSPYYHPILFTSLSSRLFPVSGAEGHPSGAAFTIMFGIIRITERLKRIASICIALFLYMCTCVCIVRTRRSFFIH